MCSAILISPVVASSKFLSCDRKKKPGERERERMITCDKLSNKIQTVKRKYATTVSEKDQDISSNITKVQTCRHRLVARASSSSGCSTFLLFMAFSTDGPSTKMTKQSPWQCRNSVFDLVIKHNGNTLPRGKENGTCES